jgi:hypothetical protein
LWNQRPERRLMPNSPHCETDDIWLRYKAEIPTSHTEPFYSIWYPEAACLSEARELSMMLMAKLGATHLGGVLITRVPPGKKVYPHNDRGSWHAEFHWIKVYVALESNAGCRTWFANDRGDFDGFRMRAGEVWQFDNQVDHFCENRGNTPRTSLIVSMSRK